MDWEGRSLRLCAAVVLLAVVLRLGAGGLFAGIGQVLEKPGVATFLVYLQTGRVVRLAPQVSAAPILHAQKPPQETMASDPDRPQFADGDLDLVEIRYDCGYDPDLENLLTKALSWDLTTGEPAVLILHTHTTESYTRQPGDDYLETGSYRTLDPGHNMLCLGELVARELEDAGISVIHDDTIHDYPSYNGSYNHAAASTAAILQEYPSIRLVLDLHRDAAETAYGQLATECAIGGQPSAQLMMVVGTDAGGLEHPDWQENLALALKLQVTLERENPGICRPMQLVYQRYNQHLGPNALLIEIGAAGNTLPEAQRAAAALARAIITLSHGSNEPD